MDNPSWYEGILTLAPGWIWLALSTIGGASIASAFLASKHKNVFLQFIADTLNVAGMNVLKATNADDDRE